MTEFRWLCCINFFGHKILRLSGPGRAQHLVCGLAVLKLMQQSPPNSYLGP